MPWILSLGDVVKSRKTTCCKNQDLYDLYGGVLNVQSNLIRMLLKNGGGLNYFLGRLYFYLFHSLTSLSRIDIFQPRFYFSLQQNLRLDNSVREFGSDRWVKFWGDQSICQAICERLWSHGWRHSCGNHKLWYQTSCPCSLWLVQRPCTHQETDHRRNRRDWLSEWSSCVTKSSA